MTGEQVGGGKVHQDQVGRLAGGDDSGIPAQGPGPIDRGHLQGLLGRDRLRVQADSLVENRGQLDLLKQVVTVVGGHPVGPQGHVDPGL